MLLRILVGVVALLFAGLLALLIGTNAGRGWVAGGAGLAVLGMAAVVEILTARVELQNDRLRVHRFGRASEISYCELAEVRIEDGRVFLRLSSGVWEGLPDWIAGGQIMSLRKRLGKRIEHPA